MNHLSNTKDISYYSDFLSSEYPVYVYYIDMSQMFMHSVRHHWHGEMEIDFVRNGSASFKIGEESVNLSAGNAIIINSNRIHSISPETDDCVIVSILFSPDFIFGDNDSFLTAKYKKPVNNNIEFPYCLVNKNIASHNEGLDAISQILNDNLQKSYGYELLTKGNLCKLWLWLLKINPAFKKEQPASLATDEERVRQGILFIHEHYGENLTLESIADNIHLSKSECCRCFKRTAALTPFEYIMKHRIYISAVKMQRGDKITDSINELAKSVGFNNASYFNKVFKNYTGITPSKFKEEIKLSHRDSLNPFGIPLSKN